MDDLSVNAMRPQAHGPHGRRIALYLADQNPHRDRSLGITSITRQIIAACDALPDVDWRILVSASSLDPATSRARKIRLPWRTDHAVGRILADNLHPWLWRHLNADTWLYPKGYVSRLARPRGRVVCVVYDTIVQYYADHYPHYRSRLDYRYWIGALRATMRQADLLLVPSLATQAQVVAFCQRYGQTVPPIRVVYAATPHESFSAHAPAKEDYLLHLSSEAPHKRTTHLLRMWLRLQESGRTLPPLRLVGRLAPDAAPILAHLHGVTLSAHLNEAEFVEAVSRATALVLPSEIEGFGLPALEAYCLGTPVCFARGGSVEEVLSAATGTGGFDIEDAADLLRAVDAVLALPHSEVITVAGRLKALYSRASFARAIHAALLPDGT